MASYQCGLAAGFSLKGNMSTITLRPTRAQETADDDRPNVIFRVTWDKGDERLEFNTLCQDDEGRFFLAETKEQFANDGWEYIWLTTPSEVGLLGAMEWAIRAHKSSWSGASGDVAALLEAAHERLSAQQN